MEPEALNTTFVEGMYIDLESDSLLNIHNGFTNPSTPFMHIWLATVW